MMVYLRPPKLKGCCPSYLYYLLHRIQNL